MISPAQTYVKSNQNQSSTNLSSPKGLESTYIDNVDSPYNHTHIHLLVGHMQVFSTLTKNCSNRYAYVCVLGLDQRLLAQIRLLDCIAARLGQIYECLSDTTLICVLILLYMCPHTGTYAARVGQISECLSDTTLMCVLLLLYMCPHTGAYAARLGQIYECLSDARRAPHERLD